jgi:FkbM family methyltransferase
MSIRLRKLTLAILRRLGLKTFRARSGLGHPYICHLGDYAGEYQFYNSDSDRLGIAVMAAWCSEEENPVIYDVGANLGFVCTQLAQAISKHNPLIIAFEPVWSTFSKLRTSITQLGLQKSIIPVCTAISDNSTFVRIEFDETQSLFAQIALVPKLGINNKYCYVTTQTLDKAVSMFGSMPSLLKIDVEGFEAHVLRGAQTLLNSRNPPAIFLEWNPIAMAEVGAEPSQVNELLGDWPVFYIDDFEGQRIEFGKQITNLLIIDWVCNIFAIPPVNLALERWQAACSKIK